MGLNKNFIHGGNIYKASRDLNLKLNKILDFSSNINPLGLSPKGVKAIKQSVKKVNSYPDPEYIDLKSKISNFYHLDPKKIFLGNGAIELIYTFVKIKKYKKALIPAPAFVEYEKALIQNSVQISFFTNKPDISTSPDVIFLCNPNNPTGYSYSNSYLKNLLDSCKTMNIDLFVDEAFIDFSTYSSILPFIDGYSNLYILRSLTKFYSIPGLRLGFLATSNKDFYNSYYENQIPWSINTIAEEYIKAAFSDTRYIKKTVNTNRIERYRLYKELVKIDFLKVYRTQGNYIFFKVLNNNIEIEHYLKNFGILIRNCGNYNNLDSTYYRIAVKKREQNRNLLQMLKKLVQ